MFAQTLAFLTRSIRQESRLLTHHAVRGAMVLLTLAAFFTQVMTAQRRGASGLFLVRSISSGCYYCLTLLGIMYFSLAITEEKEEETLPLLRMTGVRNFTLLIGKSMPRLAIVILLILVASPFLLLSITLGGVVAEQIAALILGMMCYAFCLSQVGLFCSTISRSSRGAVSIMFLLWIVLEFGSWFLSLLGFGCTQWGFLHLSQLLENAADFLWARSMWSASGEFLMYERGENVWHPQMTFHLSAGLAFFGLSWLLFERLNQAALAQGAAASENLSRGIATRTQGLRSLRCWDAALRWKSWQFQVGGWFWIVLWTIAIPVLSLGLVLAIAALMKERFEAGAYSVTLMVAGGLSGAIMLARMFGGVLNREIHQQTLVSLCMLPRSRWEVLRELYLGLLPGVLAPFSCFGLGFVLLGAIEPDSVGVFFSNVIIEPWFWAVLGWLVTTLHIGLLLSVYLRYGAMLIAMAVCCFVIPIFSSIFLSVLGMALSGLGTDALKGVILYMIPLSLIAGETGACVLIHALILQRVEVLAAK